MAYYNSQPPMAGLSSALAMQGRMGDSTLVHMNPMEVEMLKTMSPDGSLSINPETGLPEAFKLKDIAAFALPIAAGIAAPYLLPAIGISGLSGVAAGAIGAGVGGFGSGLIQGKGVGDSLIQGGLSGLMSYGLGSAFAPATQTAPQALSNVPTAAPVADSLGVGGYSAAQEAAVTQGLGAAGIGAPDGSSLIAPGTPTSGFANIGLGPKGAVPYTAAADVYTPGTSETGLGQMFGDASRTSPFGSTAFDGSQLGPTQLPTYTQIGGSVLGSAGQMALDGMLSPEEMPYDIDGMDDMDAYYASRIPDLEAGRRRGRAAARGLNYPPSGSSGSDYYSMATSPGGFGTFYAADGGRVPTDLDINGQPHRLAYINPSEENLLKSLGGSGEKINGIPAYDDSVDGGSDQGGPGPGDPGGMGLGGYSEAQATAVSTTMDAAISEANAEAAAIGEAAAYADIGSQAHGMGYGLSNPAAVNSLVAKGIMNVLSPVPTFAMRGLAKGLGNIATSLGVEGVTETATEAVASQEASQDGSGGDNGVYGRPYGDPYNTSSPATMAQGGVIQAGIGGLLKALSPAALAADTMGVVDVDKMKLGDMLQAISPAAFFAKDPKRLKYLSPAAMAAEKPSALSPAATVMMNRGMAQGGGIASLAYGGNPPPTGYANQAFEGTVPGAGTGMSDDVPFSIEGDQPALLSRDEYVLPADVVSQLGDGSSGAGSDMLDNFISQVRQTKYGNTQQPPPVGPQLMTGLMRSGGIV